MLFLGCVSYISRLNPQFSWHWGELELDILGLDLIQQNSQRSRNGKYQSLYES